ncbi:MAG: NAD(P)/FAD-dependent oxidoreductase [Candidatus Saccharibacteria bacterium]|nr:NAD(P)/FAD-dependent oxidoreductase [Candidatus Saccharibacteria bacterium]
MKKKKILISGAGPAGLSLGILLDKNKYDITLIERGPEFLSIGFAIILWQAGYEVLKDVLDSEPKNTFSINRFDIYGEEDMKKLQSIETVGVGYSIKRSDLVNQLSDQYISKCGKESVRFGTEIKNIEHFDDGTANVRFSSGLEEKYDLVVLADGMHSQLRNLFFKSKIASSPYRINYAWIKSKVNIEKEALLGFIADYCYLIQCVGEDTLLAYYNNGLKDGNENFLHNLSKAISAEEDGKLDLDEDSMRIFSAEKVSVDSSSHKNIVLIGDSFHGHPPTLAMGTTLALEDAYVLADQLNNCDYDKNTVEDCLVGYSKSRELRVSSTYNTQDLLESFFMSGNKLKIGLDTFAIKHGGWPIVENMLRKIFTSSVVKKD